MISVYDGPEDLEKFKNMCVEAKLKPNQYVIRNRFLPPEQDFGITINNRGGHMDNAGHPIKSLIKSIKEPCYYPSYNFFIDYNGDVLMCSHDWGKKYPRQFKQSNYYGHMAFKKRKTIKIKSSQRK